MSDPHDPQRLVHGVSIARIARREAERMRHVDAGS
jgi:hypothetical protein